MREGVVHSLLLVLFLMFFGCGEMDTASSSIPIVSVTESDREQAVVRHNEIRAELFSNANLTWSVDVAESAQAYADVLASNGAFEHDPSNSVYGENLFMASYQINYLDAINAWYSEKPYYNYTNNSCESGQMCGHYTQIIWKDSTEGGGGMAQYRVGQYKNYLVIVCRYNPPGNYVGEKPY